MGLGLLLLALLALLAVPLRVEAAGGVFVRPDHTGPAPVVGHTLVVARGATRLYVWDRVDVRGDRAEDLAWILPVRGNATVDLGSALFVETLAASTEISVVPPIETCPLRGRSDWTGASPEARANVPDAGVDAAIVTTPVTSPAVDAVRIAGASSGAAADWLAQEGFSVPPDARTVLDAYAREGWDFLGVKLRAARGVTGLRPLRLALDLDPGTLPFRLARFGADGAVRTRLFVLGAGRAGVDGYGAASVSASDIVFDHARGTDNYSYALSRTLAQGDGGVWVTECATQAFAGVIVRSDTPPADLTEFRAEQTRIRTAGTVVTRFQSALDPGAVQQDLRVVFASEAPLIPRQRTAGVTEHFTDVHCTGCDARPTTQTRSTGLALAGALLAGIGRRSRRRRTKSA